ncbi:UNVERIFIED_CONTAM: hypothetical protein N8J90_11830 [Halobacillus marinus]
MENLSKESSRFLENLRLYLITSGKNETETEAIVEELHDHLSEAEKQGKNVKDIIGQSPKAYMEQLSGEMEIDLKAMARYIPLIVFGGMAYYVLGDMIDGKRSYSMIELIGYPAVSVAFLFMVAAGFRALASRSWGKIMEYSVCGALGIIPIAMFIGLIFLDRSVASPSIALNETAVLTATIVPILFFIGAAVWMKTWLFIAIPAILFLPRLVVPWLSIGEETSLIVESVLIFGGMAVLLFLMNKKDNNKSAHHG